MVRAPGVVDDEMLAIATDLAHVVAHDLGARALE
jgi:hypothetical protein